MSNKEVPPTTALPFTDADLIGPEDRPKGVWEIPMYEWQAVPPAIVKDWLDEMAGTSIRAVQAAAKPEAGIIYLKACEPGAPKAHNVCITPNHRGASFSLYTPLLAFEFPKVGKQYKAVFKCWPETYGGVKLLAIQVKGYRVEKVDKDTQQVAAGLDPKAAEGALNN